MDSIRIGPSCPQIVEPDASTAPEASKPQASVEAAPSTAASSNWEKVFQPSIGDEVLIAFESGEQRMAYLTGALWKTDTPPTTDSQATKGTGASGEAKPSGGGVEPSALPHHERRAKNK